MSHTVSPINPHTQPSSFSGRDVTKLLSSNCISLMLVMCKLFLLFFWIFRTSFATKSYACSLCVITCPSHNPPPFNSLRWNLFGSASSVSRLVLRCPNVSQQEWELRVSNHIGQRSWLDPAKEKKGTPGVLPNVLQLWYFSILCPTL